MLLKAKVKYAIMALTELCLPEHKDEFTSTKHLADHLGISRLYLEQIAAILTKNHLLEGERGASGGHKIIDDYEKITLYDIVICFEDLNSFEHLLIESSPILSSVVNDKISAKLKDNQNSFLKTIKLVDLAQETIDRRDNSKVYE